MNIGVASTFQALINQIKTRLNDKQNINLSSPINTGITKATTVEKALKALNEDSLKKIIQYGNVWSDKVQGGSGNHYGNCIQTDGDNIYSSNGEFQYVLNRDTNTWIGKVQNGMPIFDGEYIQSDGNNIYYSAGSTQKILDKATSTQSDKTWNEMTDFNREQIQSDGTNIYYSNGSTQKVLDISTSTWSDKTWNGFTEFYGKQIQFDGNNIYYSYSSEWLSESTHKILDVSTSTWSDKTQNGYIYVVGQDIQSDGTNVYYSDGSVQYVLDKDTDTQNAMEQDFSGAGHYIQTDGLDIYFSMGDTEKILSRTELIPIYSSEKGVANGVATLGSDGKVPSAQLPPIGEQADWEEVDSTSAAFIKNKPTLGEAASRGVTTRVAGSDNVNLTTSQQVYNAVANAEHVGYQAIDNLDAVAGQNGKNKLRNNLVQVRDNFAYCATNKRVDIQADGSIHVQDGGTVNKRYNIVLNNNVVIDRDMILSGCPAGGSGSSYKLQIVRKDDDTIYADDLGSGISVPVATFGGTGVTCKVQLVLYSNYAVANELWFYPMLRDASIVDDTQEPYFTKLNASSEQEQADWTELDSTSAAFIKNKPTLGTAALKDAGVANGVAELGSDGKVPSSQLPSTGPSAYTSNPTMNGIASAGSSNDYSRGDHVHPSDTSKQNVQLSSSIDTGMTTASTVEDALNALNNDSAKKEYYGFGDTWSTKTQSGFNSFDGQYIWTDGDNIYYSSNSSQYVLNKSTNTWNTKTWNGVTKPPRQYIWIDGDNIYYSNGSTQRVLDKSSSTQRNQTQKVLTNFYGTNIWTDGTNIYYSNSSTQYVLDKSTSTWSTKTQSGLSSFDGMQIWTDGEDIYYSSGSDQYVLDKSTSTWSTKTWNGLSSLVSLSIQSDGTNIYYSNGSTQRVLKKSTSAWNTKTQSGLSSFNGINTWTDGDNIYYSTGSAQYVLSKAKRPPFYHSDIITTTTDPGAGSALDTGKLLLVYEA